MKIRNISLLLILLFMSCSAPTDRVFIYEGRTIGESEIFDNFVIEVSQLESTMDYRVSGSKYVEPDSFRIVESQESLTFQSRFCDEEVVVKFIDKYRNDTECLAHFPLFLESVTLLDTKDVIIGDLSYSILKLSNESYADSSLVIWLKGFGILLIRKDQGRYYMLKEVENTVVPWRKILSQVMADLDFCELWPIPPAPPPPPEVIKKPKR